MMACNPLYEGSTQNGIAKAMARNNTEAKWIQFQQRIGETERSDYAIIYRGSIARIKWKSSTLKINFVEASSMISSNYVALFTETSLQHSNQKHAVLFAETK